MGRASVRMVQRTNAEKSEFSRVLGWEWEGIQGLPGKNSKRFSCRADKRCAKPFKIRFSNRGSENK